ncbi:MAG: hypothetical protein F4230_07550, partial [Holophagales bacterium]|nr:hypothetical protein [Holophagales bacterium]
MAKIENKPSRWEVAEGSPMALIERAQLLISNPNKNERDELLHDCVLAGTSDALAAVQMLAEDMYDGDSFNVLMKWPAAWCLVAWEERGLRALIEITKRAPTSKNYSISFQVLATLSAEEDLPDSWLTSEIKTAIHARVKNWDGVYSGARVKLNALARSIESDYEAALYAAIPMPYLAATASSAIKPLFLAMSTRWLSLGDTTLTDYERLLKESGDDEPALHQFLEKHPQLLDPAALEVWSKPDLSGAKEPDFVIRRIDDTYLVVEVETPSKTLITRGCRCSAES